jgi:hypothetical protein
MYENTPRDCHEPDWASSSRVHCWRNYISEELMALWGTFTMRQQAAIARNAQSLADMEDWE